MERQWLPVRGLTHRCDYRHRIPVGARNRRLAIRGGNVGCASHAAGLAVHVEVDKLSGYARLIASLPDWPCISICRQRPQSWLARLRPPQTARHPRDPLRSVGPKSVYMLTAQSRERRHTMTVADRRSLLRLFTAIKWEKRKQCPVKAPILAWRLRQHLVRFFLMRRVKRRCRAWLDDSAAGRIAALRRCLGLSASLRGPTRSESGYFLPCQHRLEAVINDAQSSGGFPRASFLAKTAYGSVLLPEERSVDWSLTHA